MRLIALFPLSFHSPAGTLQRINTDTDRFIIITRSIFLFVSNFLPYRLLSTSSVKVSSQQPIYTLLITSNECVNIVKYKVNKISAISWQTCNAGHFLLLTETTACHLTLGHYMFLKFKSLKVKLVVKLTIFLTDWLRHLQLICIY